jgi:hypothetical protein
MAYFAHNMFMHKKTGNLITLLITKHDCCGYYLTTNSMVHIKVSAVKMTATQFSVVEGTISCITARHRGSMNM